MSETKISLSALRALDEKATPGPWRIFSGCNDEGDWCACGPMHYSENEGDYDPGGPADKAANADAALIAATRNALPVLLAIAEAAMVKAKAEKRLSDLHANGWSYGDREDAEQAVCQANKDYDAALARVEG